jgi:hypothetical protein
MPRSEIDRFGWSFRAVIAHFWFDGFVVLLLLVVAVSLSPWGVELPANVLQPVLSVSIVLGFCWIVSLLVHKESNIRRGGKGFFG